MSGPREISPAAALRAIAGGIAQLDAHDGEAALLRLHAALDGEQWARLLAAVLVELRAPWTEIAARSRWEALRELQRRPQRLSAEALDLLIAHVEHLTRVLADERRRGPAAA